MTASSLSRQTSTTETLLSRQSSYKDETKINATERPSSECTSRIRVCFSVRLFRVIYISITDPNPLDHGASNEPTNP